MSRDKLFIIVLLVLFAFMSLFTIGGIALAIWGDPTETVSLRLVGAVGSMFASVVGLVLGYLVGRHERNGNGN